MRSIDSMLRAMQTYAPPRGGVVMRWRPVTWPHEGAGGLLDLLAAVRRLAP